MHPASFQRAPGGRFTDYDAYLFREGNHFRLFDKLGAHTQGDETRFAVWAPNATQVSVIGDFNGWCAGQTRLESIGDTGIWAGTVAGVGPGTLYKYQIQSRGGGSCEKADPCGFWQEEPPRTASVVQDLEYAWHDRGWMAQRKQRNALDAAWAIYEIHLGSWRRKEGNRSLSYRELADILPAYLTQAGFTHVEFMPVTEHPFYGSWGYQTTGYFAPSARYGRPRDLMYLIDVLHQAGIGVILDWVPSHFPTDAHGLAYFDGTHLYEHADPRQGFHPEWKSSLFNYARNEVREFLVSSALFWLEHYHMDGLRVDGVASMLYLDYARESGEWIPNEHGGKENLAAIQFLRTLNEQVYAAFPDVQTIAEESTAWPMVSRPTSSGGLGFGMKWNLGWMHDTLSYFQHDPVHRRYHQDELTFSLIYAFNENYVLPLSHDEVVHGKGSLLARMPGDDWQQFANLRLLLGYMYAHPGKKLLFMGSEFAQGREWTHDHSLDWHLLDVPQHAGVHRWVQALGHFYKTHPALFRDDFSPAGFEWVDAADRDQSVLSFLRKSPAKDEEVLLIIANFTPVPRYGYRVGVPGGHSWRPELNSDDGAYGGSGIGPGPRLRAEPVGMHGRPYSLALTLPPLAVVFLVREGS